ncbi:cuticle protein 3-like [Aricia agestis]|uniref:cuticle protein 3-like n=1 Tax=Aricia agestis TaxID=91739 RepID=UPI001C20A424|nr:cuticle protein 3-like [Aricia agestis]
MQLLIIASVLGLAAAALGPAYNERPQAQYERNARILAQDSDVKEDSYRYSYETENGIRAQEQGSEAEGIEAEGAFSYTGDDGNIYTITYRSGKEGFNPQGAHIPTPPPIPQEILVALEQNARDEAAGIFDDGLYRAGKYEANAPRQPSRPIQNQPFRQPYKF